MFLYINFLNKIIPNIVKDELIRESIEKKRWSKPNTSISNQPIPEPTFGTERKAKTIMAVPTIVFLISDDIFANKFLIKKITIPSDPKKTISWERGWLINPIADTKITKIKLPKIIEKSGLGIVNLIVLVVTIFDRNTPMIEINGIIKAYKYIFPYMLIFWSSVISAASRNK